jgi:hypothetical protein
MRDTQEVASMVVDIQRLAKEVKYLKKHILIIGFLKVAHLGKQKDLFVRKMQELAYQSRIIICKEAQ